MGKYREDIDGLRAIAVLGVLFFHINMPFCPGGFLGVDVFFVLSGFLITGIILGELRDPSKAFSYLRFIERRAKRILPVLFVMLMATVPFAWLILTPRQMDEFVWS